MAGRHRLFSLLSKEAGDEALPCSLDTGRPRRGRGGVAALGRGAREIRRVQAKASAQPPREPMIFASPIHGGCYIAAPGQCKIHVEPILDQHRVRDENRLLPAHSHSGRHRDAAGHLRLAPRPVESPSVLGHDGHALPRHAGLRGDLREQLHGQPAGKGHRRFGHLQSRPNRPVHLPEHRTLTP